MQKAERIAGLFFRVLHEFAKPSSGYTTVDQQASMMRAALALALCLACVAHAAVFPASAPAPAPSTPEIQGLTHVDTVGCNCRCPGLLICWLLSNGRKLL